MNKPQLYWLHSHFLLSTGGTRFAFEVISRLAQDYNITVIVEKTSPEWQEKFHQAGVKVTPIAPLSSNSLIYWLLLPVFLAYNHIKIKQIIPRNSLVVTSMFPMNYLANFISNKHLYYCFEPFAFFYDQDLIDSFSRPKQLLLTLLKILYSPLDKKGVKKASLLMGINPSVGKHINNIYDRTPNSYSYLGVDIHHFNSKVKPLKKRSAKTVRLFHSTDYSTLKGTHFLLQALSQVQNKSVHLYISESVQNSQQKKKYQDFLSDHKLSDRVHFLGHLSYAQLPQAYTYCDIYCFTGSPDSVGATAASLSVLEASASGMAVIRSIGNTDEVIDGKTGVITDPRQSKQLAQVIDQLAKASKKRALMGVEGKKYILQKYTWDKVSDRIKRSIAKLEKD